MGFKGIGLLSFIALISLTRLEAKEEDCRSAIEGLGAPALALKLIEVAQTFSTEFKSTAYGAKDLSFAARDLPGLVEKNPTGLQKLRKAFDEVQEIMKALMSKELASPQVAQQVFATLLDRVILSQSFLFSAYVVMKTSDSAATAENFDIAMTRLLQHLEDKGFDAPGTEDDLDEAAEAFVENFNSDLVHPDHLETGVRMLDDLYAKKNGKMVAGWLDSRIKRSQKLRKAFAVWMPKASIVPSGGNAIPVSSTPTARISTQPPPQPNSNAGGAGEGGTYGLAP